MKKTRKLIAILLSVLTLMSVVSAATPVFAAEVTELTENPETKLDVTETDTEEAGENESEEADILYEDTSRRDEHTKHFVMSNGLRKAIRYSQPVHYKENDEWVDIDNTLEYNYKSNKYQNKCNSFKVQFDKQFNSEELFTIENKGYTMSWRYNGDSLYTAFSNGQIDKSANINGGFDKFTHKTNGKIKYNKIESECSLEYIVTGTGVKENIILESYTGKNSFSFEVTAKNLEFIKNEDKSISVVNKNGEEIFYIPAPFMFDANNKYCYDVEYSVNHKKDKYIISIVADENWLKKPDTKYPVTIDPVIETQKTKTAIDTTFIASGNPNTNYDAMRDVYIGVESSDYEKCRALFKFDLPELNSGDMVVSATLGVWLHSTSFYTTTMPDKQINAHIVTSSWSAENVTWNTKPLFDSNVSDYNFIKQSDVSGSIYEKAFDISRAVKEWYEGTTTNNGIMIKADVEDGSDADVAARGVFWSDKYNGNEDLYPYIEITYRNNKGLESYWSYSSFGIGVAGTAHINDYTGNLVYELPIASSISEKMPVSIVGYYNNYCANELISETEAKDVRTSIGRGFRLIYQQTVLPSTKYGLTGKNAEKYPYVYTDGDGTEHYIQKVTEDGKTVYKDEDGLGLTLTTELDANESGTYKITDKAHNKYYFNIRGNLFRIVDNNGNKINIQFKDENTANNLLDKSRIDKIIDGAGHTYTFKYYVKSSTGVELDYVESITDNAGRTVNFNISGGLLDKVSYFNGDSVDIVYENTTEGIINYIQSNKSYRINFDYTSISTGRRVKKVKEYGVLSDGETVTDTENGQVITFDRSKYNTTIMRSCGLDGKHVADYSTNGDDDIITTIQFDNMGRAISQQMKFGSGAEIGAGSVAYTSTSADEAASGFKNKVSGSGATGKYVENLLYSGNAEEISPWAYATVGTLTATTAETTTSTAYMGKNSLKLNISKISTENARCYYRQALTGISAGDAFTLSGYVKTSDLTKFSNASLTGAFLELDAYNSSGTLLKSTTSQVLTSKTDTEVNKGWRRLSTTITVPENTATLRVYLVLRNVTGTAYFDCIQLEKGSTVNDFNMLENSHFTKKSTNTPTSWSKSGDLEFSTGTSVANGVVVTENAMGNNTYAMKITGEPDALNAVAQTVAVEGNPNDTYILSGWGKANAVNSTYHTALTKGKDTETTDDDEYSETALFEIGVRVNYSVSDGTTHHQYKPSAKFNTTISDWQCASVPIVLKCTDGETGKTYTPTGIRIILKYKNQENIAYFDKIMLVKDAASSYTYDKDGNLVSASSNSEQKSNMEYDDANNLTSYTDSAGFKTELSYEENTNNLNYTTSAKGVYTNYDYDSYGNVTSSDVRNKGKIAEATAVIKTTNGYNVEKELTNTTINEGAYRTSSTDSNGNTTHYTSDYATGTLTKVKNAKNVETTYEYYPTTNNKNFGKQKSITTGNSKVTYEYNGKQQLNKIIFGNTTKEEYYFEYDAFGNITQTKVGSQPLCTNTFKPFNGVLEKTEYGNGDSRRYSYNNFGQKIVDYVTDNGTQTKAYSWAYNDSGISTRHTDYINRLQYLFDYDSLGRISKEEVKDYDTGSFVGYTEYGYDVRNNLTKLITNYGGKANTQRYYYSTVDENENSANYRKDNLPTKYKLYSNRYAIYDYDGINRLNQRKFTLDNTALYYNYIYKLSDRNAENEKTYKTTQVAEEYIGNDVYIYDYDVLGNITSIRTAERKSTVETEADFKEYINDADYVEYSYDDLGQLTRENLVGKNTTVWNYDELGNIITKSEYDYTTESTDGKTAKNTVTYYYKEDDIPYREEPETTKTYTSWNNLLLSIDLDGSSDITEDEVIEYDEIGNPEKYLGASLSWNGRQLTSYTTADKTISYKYDSNGLRTSKTVNGVTSKYFYVNGKLHYEERSDGTKLYFYYDSNDYLTGIEYNGNNLYTATNLRGDVLAIYKNTGECIARYEYDAWGNVISVIDCDYYDETQEKIIEKDITNDLSSTDIAMVNPIRYRGYYYDVETNFYYLQSRYYNPKVGRFLNSDSISDSGAGVLGFNTFIYCANNPVNATDPSGHWIIKDAIKWVAKNIVKPVVKTIKEKLSKVDLTYSTGYNVSGTPSIWCFNGQIGVSVDTKGNVAIQASGGAGATQGDPGISFTRYKCITNTPSINDLNGPGYQLGGSSTVPIGDVPVALGGDFNIIPNEEKNTTCYGVTTNSGLGFGPSTKEFHVEWGTTITVPKTQFNVFDVAQSVYIKIMEW